MITAKEAWEKTMENRARKIPRVLERAVSKAIKNGDSYVYVSRHRISDASWESASVLLREKGFKTENISTGVYAGNYKIVWEKAGEGEQPYR